MKKTNKTGNPENKSVECICHCHHMEIGKTCLTTKCLQDRCGHCEPLAADTPKQQEWRNTKGENARRWKGKDGAAKERERVIETIETLPANTFKDPASKHKIIMAIKKLAPAKNGRVRGNKIKE